ncbi:hypothetical protein [Paenibacillus medicaginis]|uniref:Uncharacterized protein n=1 Tax=Paenibacillus medicaginis TaxID=1470560 RepID=A0ABV5BUJ5_9BACL
MRNTRIEEIKAKKEFTNSVVCNKCGKIDKGFYEEEQDSNLTFQDTHRVTVDFEGEDSKYRTNVWRFDLCDKCLTDFVKTFKFAPEWFGGSLGVSSQMKFKEWKEHNGEVG